MLAAIGIDHKDLQFLVGKKNLYQEFQNYVHNLRVPVIAAALSQIGSRPSCSSSREAAYKKIWLWLTGTMNLKMLLEMIDIWEQQALHMMRVGKMKKRWK